MNDNSGKLIVLDGIVKDASEAVSVDSVSGRTAYEVLRIIRGVPLFFEDHFDISAYAPKFMLQQGNFTTICHYYQYISRAAHRIHGVSLQSQDS